MKLIFVHIPKCAGTSISETFNGVNFHTWGHDLRKMSYKSYPESNLYLAIRLLPFFFRSKYYSFSVVRNSWDRAYSAYKFLNSGGKNEFDNHDREKYLKPFVNFEDFVLNGLEQAVRNQLHFKSQLYWISKKDKIVVDKVLYFDKLESDLSQLFLDIGLPQKSLPLLNQSRTRESSNVYSPITIQKIFEIYREEIEAFDFQPPF